MLRWLENVSNRAISSIRSFLQEFLAVDNSHNDIEELIQDIQEFKRQIGSIRTTVDELYHAFSEFKESMEDSITNHELEDRLDGILADISRMQAAQNTQEMNFDELKSDVRDLERKSTDLDHRIYDLERDL